MFCCFGKTDDYSSLETISSNPTESNQEGQDTDQVSHVEMTDCLHIMRVAFNNLNVNMCSLCWNQNKERIQVILRHGLPSAENLLFKDNFVISYNYRTQVPNWELHHISKEQIPVNDSHFGRAKLGLEFYEDETIDPTFRANLDDYKGSRFDKGHMSPSCDHPPEVRGKTFILTNVCPQVGKGFNNGIWKRLEKHCLGMAYTNDVWVCTGPLYLPGIKNEERKSFVKYEVIGKNEVAVPTHLFKMILIQRKKGKFDFECYVMPNVEIGDEIPIDNYIYSQESDIKHWEKKAGIKWFHNIIAQNMIRKIRAKS